ncbi:unnamed protein product [Parajaminaea phylloscopi]
MTSLLARSRASTAKAASIAMQSRPSARRTLAQVSDRHVDHAALEPFLLEDIVSGMTPEQVEKVPQFTISRQHGFLPREDPLVKMPDEFRTLDSLLDRMTIRQYDAQGQEAAPGLLAKGDFGPAVKHELKVGGIEHEAVDRAIADGNQRLLSALFRDYCFATSAYLFEPTDISYRKSGLYAPGRDVLPAQLAIPLKKLADALGHQPFMEYASSYALVNYKFRDPNLAASDTAGQEAGRYSFSNLDLIRAFQDPKGSERGFIGVHITMVAFSGQAVSAAEDVLTATVHRDIRGLENALERLLNTYRKINTVMETMWARSKPSDYLSFRTFIFGTAPKKGNPMFPNGVIYEGVSDEPFHLRGESGANDSLVPLLDNLLEITASLPNNELTRTLRDFRSYRPKTQREYIGTLEGRASGAGVKNFALLDDNNSSAKSKALYLLLVDQVREFRNRHWLFAREYIIKQTRFPLATGGSAMLAYLPNNLSVVLSFLDEAYASFTSADCHQLESLGEHKLLAAVHEAGKRAATQRKMLHREVETLKKAKEEQDKALGEGKAQTEGSGMIGHDHAAATGQQTEPKPMQRGMVGCDGVG